MSCRVTIIGIPPPAKLCFPQSWWEWLSTALSILLNDCEEGIDTIRSVTAPLDPTVTWERVSEDGCPIGDFVKYLGVWRRKPTVNVGTRVLYTGLIDGFFDPITFKGLIGEEWDGWEIDFTNANTYTVIASEFNGVTDMWESRISSAPLPSGGSSTKTLIPENVPTVQPRSSISLPTAKANGNGPLVTGILYGIGSDYPINIAPEIPATTGTAFQTLPPYVVKAEVVYRGICQI